MTRWFYLRHYCITFATLCMISCGRSKKIISSTTHNIIFSWKGNEKKVCNIFLFNMKFVQHEALQSNSKLFSFLMLNKYHPSIFYCSCRYSKVWKSIEFRKFSLMTAELQPLDISKLDDTEKTCFFINIYNTLLLHGLMRFSAPSDPLELKLFYDQTR